jgi:hypothetical protein
MADPPWDIHMSVCALFLSQVDFELDARGSYRTGQ